MAKIRHIAYRAEDTEAMARFFVAAFEMEIAQHRPNGAIDLTDGTVNITILPANGPGASGNIGIDHMGKKAARATSAIEKGRVSMMRPLMCSPSQGRA